MDKESRIVSRQSGKQLNNLTEHTMNITYDGNENEKLNPVCKW